MPYFPGIPPENLDDWRRWLADELNRINPNIVEGQEYMGFKVHYAEPDKYEIGQMVFADGTDWNPGAGQGLYEYTNLGWQKLGEGDGGQVPISHSALQDLISDDHPQYHTDARGDVRYYTKTYIDNLTLPSLADVAITLPEEGEVLTWDDTEGEWVNKPGAAVGSGLPNDINGGGAYAVYLFAQNFDGGDAYSVYLPSQIIDAGGII